MGPALESNVGWSLVIGAECWANIVGSLVKEGSNSGVKIPTGLHLGTKSGLSVGLYTVKVGVVGGTFTVGVGIYTVGLVGADSDPSQTCVSVLGGGGNCAGAPERRLSTKSSGDTAARNAIRASVGILPVGLGIGTLTLGGGLISGSVGATGCKSGSRGMSGSISA